MQDLRSKRAFICDMDGVIYHGDRLLPGVPETVLVLSGVTQRDDLRQFAYAPRYVLGGVGEIAAG